MNERLQLHLEWRFVAVVEATSGMVGASGQPQAFEKKTPRSEERELTRAFLKELATMACLKPGLDHAAVTGYTPGQQGEKEGL